MAHSEHVDQDTRHEMHGAHHGAHHEAHSGAHAGHDHHAGHEAIYRRLFWECGMIGQVLYLEAEAAGARATGIGCFYDDPVHDAAGLSGMEWQSLYHFSMGVPVDDDRLTTLPGYEWEKS